MTLLSGAQALAEGHIAPSRGMVETSWFSDSSQQSGTSNKVGYHYRLLPKRGADIEYVRALRFGAANSALALLYEIETESRFHIAFGGASLIQDAEITHLPYSSAFGRFEHPIPTWGSGTIELQTRFYPATRVHLLSYAVVVERVEGWLLIPKVYLSRAEFQQSSNQSTDASSSLRVVRRLQNFEASLALAYGREAFADNTGVVTTLVHSTEAALRYSGFKAAIPYLSFLVEYRPQLHKTYQQIFVGLEVFGW